MLYFLVAIAASILIAVRFGLSSRIKPFIFLLWVISALLALFYIISDRLSGNGIDESVLYHLQVGLGGASISEFYIEIIGGVLCLLFIVAGVTLFYRRMTSRTTAGLAGVLSMGFAITGLSLNPAVADIYKLMGVYQMSTQHASVSAENFPAFRGVGGKLQKNIVYIYLEGLERTYLDQQLFPGLLPNIGKLEKQALSFTNLHQVYGAGWTIAGITASQCGMPLVAAGGANTMAGMDSFLPGAVCLGDILTRYGYDMSFMGGAELEFAGKGKFFETHSYESVRGYEELRELMPDRKYRSPWGLYDDTLFGLAKSRYDELAASDTPFGLVLLTLDTHHPRGHMPKQCGALKYADGQNAILNAVHCSDRLVADLMAHIAASPAAANTMVVIASDHLGMPNTATDLLRKGNRKNLFLVLNSGLEPAAIGKPGSTLDAAPTVISLLGGKLDALGYGRNLLGEQKTLLEKYDQSIIATNNFLSSNIAFLKGFWNFPEITDGLELASESDARLELGSRSVSVPVLLTLNDESKVEQVYFDINSPKKLYQHVEAFPTTQGFIWIDQCTRAMSVLSASAARNEGKYCIFSGHLGGKESLFAPLHDGADIDFAKLQRSLKTVTDEKLRETQASAIREWSKYQVGKVMAYVPADSPAQALQGDIGIRSSGGGSGGGSFLRNNKGDAVVLERGLTLLGLRVGAAPEKLAYIDSCETVAVNNGGTTTWNAGLGTLLQQHARDYGAFAVVAHDSAVCGKSSLKGIFQGGPLKNWQAIGFRAPYIGIISGSGEVKEFSGPAEEAIAVEAKAFIQAGAAQL